METSLNVTNSKEVTNYMLIIEIEYITLACLYTLDMSLLIWIFFYLNSSFRY